jgi:GNAT superfamily N-acetyltransferase
VSRRVDHANDYAWFHPRRSKDIVIGAMVAYEPRRLAELQELYDLLDPTLPALQRQRVKLALRAPGVTILAALDPKTDRLVGIATLVTAPTLPRMRAWAEDLVVHPEFRGRRIGEALMDECAALASEAGALMMEGTVHPTRTSALALHRRAGWEIGSSVAVRRHLQK